MCLTALSPICRLTNVEVVVMQVDPRVNQRCFINVFFQSVNDRLQLRQFLQQFLRRHTPQEMDPPAQLAMYTHNTFFAGLCDKTTLIRQACNREKIQRLPNVPD